MKTITVDEFKAHFAEVINQVKTGESFTINSSENNEIIGYFSSNEPKQKSKRQLGTLKGKLKFEFKPDFKITDEELCGYPKKHQ